MGETDYNMCFSSMSMCRVLHLCLQRYNLHFRTAHQIACQYCAQQTLSSDGKPYVALGNKAESPNWLLYEQGVWTLAKKIFFCLEISLDAERIPASQNQDDWHSNGDDLQQPVFMCACISMHVFTPAPFMCAYSSGSVTTEILHTNKKHLTKIEVFLSLLVL